MELTEQQLLHIMPNARKHAGVFVSAINAAAKRWQFDRPKRMAMFLAQVGHESGQLQFTRELGGNAYLAKYDTGRLAERLGNTPEADGDGQFYRGRGLIQITGRFNYLKCSAALFGDDRLLRTPELLEQPEWAAQSAGWFWWTKELNTLADQGLFTKVTRKINGGVNGLKDRLELWERAREVLQ
ncbi:glycoside hydrolase family 19 protein [Pseudomonas sp. S9]|uniref:glycoside hydrolase family 19 protein n=1 Tax=Pseudomonas sp. S9 TaxID=686578 RepID=UPI0002557003|nr:glycoside hydrolase family 19 protein [Pseudomonas sp. S9]